MFPSASPRFLHHVLVLDAATCLGSGALQLGAPVWMAHLTGLPGELLLESGLFLLVYAAGLLWLANRDPIPAPAVWLIVAGNAGWVLACIALMSGPWVQATGWGQIYLAVHTVTVLLMALLQWRGLRGLRAARLATV